MMGNPTRISYLVDTKKQLINIKKPLSGIVDNSSDSEDEKFLLEDALKKNENGKMD